MLRALRHCPIAGARRHQGALVGCEMLGCVVLGPEAYRRDYQGALVGCEMLGCVVLGPEAYQRDYQGALVGCEKLGCVVLGPEACPPLPHDARLMNRVSCGIPNSSCVSPMHHLNVAVTASNRRRAIQSAPSQT